MSTSDSATVTPQLPITEEPPIHSGTTDNMRLPPSVKPWAQLTPAHQDMLVNVHTICKQIVLVSNTTKIAHARLNATEVANHIADALANTCPVKGDKISDAFKTVACATLCDPGRMVRMARANDLNEFCQAIPPHLRAICGCTVVIEPKRAVKPEADNTAVEAKAKIVAEALEAGFSPQAILALNA